MNLNYYDIIFWIIAIITIYQLNKSLHRDIFIDEDIRN